MLVDFDGHQRAMCYRNSLLIVFVAGFLSSCDGASPQGQSRSPIGPSENVVSPTGNATWYEYACRDHHPPEWCDRVMQQMMNMLWNHSHQICRNAANAIIEADANDQFLHWPNDEFYGEDVSEFTCFVAQGPDGQTIYCRDEAYGLDDHGIRDLFTHEGVHFIDPMAEDEYDHRGRPIQDTPAWWGGYCSETF